MVKIIEAIIGRSRPEEKLMLPIIFDENFKDGIDTGKVVLKFQACI